VRGPSPERDCGWNLAPSPRCRGARARAAPSRSARMRASWGEDRSRALYNLSFQTADLVPAARFFAPGVLPLCFARPDEGVAERRETYGCLRGIRWVCTIGAGQAPSEAPCVPIRGTPASRRSHRGDFGLRGRASPHRHCGRIGHSKLPHPGRSARRGPLPPGAAVANRRRGTPRLAPPSGCLRTTPLEEQGWEDSYYTSQNAVN
jgi:hypothetical protein